MVRELEIRDVSLHVSRITHHERIYVRRPEQDDGAGAQQVIQEIHGMNVPLDLSPARVHYRHRS